MGEHGDNREGSELIEGHLRQSLGRDVAVFGGREASNELAEVELEVGMGRSVEPGGGEGGVLDGLAPGHVHDGPVGAAGHEMDDTAGLVEIALEGMMEK